ncbi:nuclear transport factor 2-like [Platysternon megacephalum]|uniref:Nuclear transport factor 2-like n=1 Tax=Platysternon megacephalum TaxID=55544 RepID=A0A4D9E9B8_9SAUR|nr:nuclear transport factor 2-like [Platysternon megacephalum]
MTRGRRKCAKVHRQPFVQAIAATAHPSQTRVIAPQTCSKEEEVCPAPSLVRRGWTISPFPDLMQLPCSIHAPYNGEELPSPASRITFCSSGTGPAGEPRSALGPSGTASLHSAVAHRLVGVL